MPGSAASTVASTPMGKVGSRQERSMLSALAKGLSTNKDFTRQKELEYINDQLNFDDSDLVGDLASLLRNGTLRKAIDLFNGKDSSAGMGKELAPSQTTLRSLRDATLQELLNGFVEGNEAKFNEMPRETKCKLVTYALGVGPRESLPKISSALRYTFVLRDYCKCRYRDLGNRLAEADLDNPGAIGYFKVAGSKVVLVPKPHNNKNPVLPTSVQVALLESADDPSEWEIVDNHSYDAATLVCDSQCLRIKLQPLFEKNNCAKPHPETLDRGIKMERWPEGMTKASSLTADDEGDGDANAERPKRAAPKPKAKASSKRPKKGDGRAKR